MNVGADHFIDRTGKVIIMNGIVYIVGAVVIILALLSFIGLR